MFTRSLLVGQALLISSLLLTTPALNSMESPFDSENMSQNSQDPMEIDELVITIEKDSAQQDIANILNTIHKQLLHHRDIELNKGSSPHEKWNQLTIKDYIAYNWISFLVSNIFKRDSQNVESLLNNLNTKNIEKQMPLDRIEDLIFILKHCKTLNMPYPRISKSIFAITCCSLEYIKQSLKIDLHLKACIQRLERVKKNK